MKSVVYIFAPFYTFNVVLLGRSWMGIRKYLWKIFGDRRKVERHDAAIPVDYAEKNGPINLFFHTVNICRFGAFIQTNKPLPVGTELELTLSVPDVEQDAIAQPIKVTCQAIVIHVQDGSKGLPRGMGVKFINITEKDWSVVGRFLIWQKSHRGKVSVPAKGDVRKLKDADLGEEKVKDLKETQSELAKEFELLEQESKRKKG